MERADAQNGNVSGSKFAFGTPAEIFLVDDELKSLEVGEVILKSKGFTVRTFQDPGKAFDTFHDSPTKPSLLITDYSMPQMNGVELMVKCRQICPELKVIILSGTLENEALDRYPFKVDAFFEKPFHSQEFAKMVTDLLNRPSIGSSH